MLSYYTIEPCSSAPIHQGMPKGICPILCSACPLDKQTGGNKEIDTRPGNQNEPAWLSLEIKELNIRNKESRRR